MLRGLDDTTRLQSRPSPENVEKFERFVCHEVVNIKLKTKSLFV